VDPRNGLFPQWRNDVATAEANLARASANGFPMAKFWEESRMRHVRWTVLPAVVAFTPFSDACADPAAFQVHAETFDPAKTNLVFSQWVKGAGCPSDAPVATYPATKPTDTYTEPVCATGDPNDTEVEGLLLLKNGPTSNNASAGATITGLPNNLTLTELGYDIPKSLMSGCGGDAPAGSGNESPRFNIISSAGSFFVTCYQRAPATPSRC
jgi:hypothetical protein